jgi:PHP family Zn ribbon phosphoesterase
MVTTIDDYIRSLENLKNQFGGDAHILAFNRLLDEREYAIISISNMNYDGVYIAMDEAINQVL